SFASLLSEIAGEVEHVLGQEFDQHGYEARNAPMYAQMLVGMIALTGQWWLDAPRRPRREEVAAHVVNLAWNGLSELEARPSLDPRQRRKERERRGKRLEKVVAKQEKADEKAAARAEKAVERAERAAEKAAERLAAQLEKA